MSEVNLELAQLVVWMQDDAALRQFVLTHREQALAALAEAGYALSERDRGLLERLTPENFARQAERLPAGRRDVLTLPAPELDLTPPPEVMDYGKLLYCLRSDAALRAQFFANPRGVLNAIAADPRYTLSEADYQRLLTVNEANFMAQVEKTGTTRGGPTVALDDLDVPSERVVSTGFAAQGETAVPLPADRPLPADAAHYFWFEVGAPVPGSIEAENVALPDTLPPDVRLQVVLFSFDREIRIMPGQDVGEIEVPGTGPVRVVRQAARQLDGVPAEMLARRLFFPVRTPAAAGAYRLRCAIYYRQTLVQSRLVTIHVGAAPPAGQPALVSVVDYTLSRTLNGHQLQAMGETKLSVMLNDNGNGTHGFRLFGEHDFKQDVAVGEGEVATYVNLARGAMRKAAWGDEAEFEEAKVKLYRYADGKQDMAQLRLDLIRFAQRGFSFFTDLIMRLAGAGEGAPDPWTLRDWLRAPGQVQFATKQNANLVVPVALFYDYPLDDGLPLDAYSLCETFTAALQSGERLSETACFRGACPQYDDDTVICPSGFWGYRHQIGLPVSLPDTAPDAAVKIQAAGAPALAVGISTDPAFEKRDAHLQALQAMGFGWELADTRDDTLALLKKTQAQVVYFYCHGGVAAGQPFLSVGPKGGARIKANAFFNKGIRWQEPKPLVVINGCHTTALSPEAAMNLVRPLVGLSHAAGVIGTEITIFEPIAVAFAEAFFGAFLGEKRPLGEAVRLARLRMLQDWNPLGLVYIPFALPGLRLAS
ncbi:MAG: hypothetical protein KC425_20125 [Anaerolineales bacterium]|nr:hypothetical protein [Anaerolineales bacterium]